MRRFAFEEDTGFWDQDLRFFGQRNIKFWSEMGPYGSVGAHIKTGESSMAQDHFQTPPDPKRAHKNRKMTQRLWLGSRWDNFYGPKKSMSNNLCQDKVQ